MIIETRSAKETYDLGKKIGSHAKAGEVYTLVGDLGVGKTVFTQGLAKGLGLTVDVTSPTFAICNTYRQGDVTLHHFDMYRVDSWDDLYSTGFFDYLDTGAYLAIEWSENVYGALPPDTLMVEISKTGEQDRTIEIYKKEEEKA